jgi:hypothetical protein
MEETLKGRQLIYFLSPTSKILCLLMLKLVTRLAVYLSVQQRWHYEPTHNTRWMDGLPTLLVNRV